MTTCRTPMKSAAACCSSARFLASAAGVSDRSAVPAAPFVHSTYVTSHPAAAHLATTPPEPISASSGWAKITIALSGISVTISSLGALASLGIKRFYRTRYHTGTMTNQSFPLARFKVLDLTRARAGPTCVRQLVDWGAHAIKIETPGGRTGDGMGGNRHGFDFQNLHRNTRSLTLNLRDPEGVAIFKELARETDIVVENYRPGVKERLGIDYKTLRAINPRLIYGSISGFGQSGPYRDRPGVDQIAQGMGGLMSITGIPGQGPVRVGIPIADLCSGIFLAQGILVALIERETTGEGKWVHTSLLEAMLSMLDFQASRWLMAREVPPQAGNNHPTGIPTGVFETKDGHINIAAAGDDIYGRFCRAVERPDLLTDPRFSTSKARSTNRDIIMEVIMPVTRQKTSAEGIKHFNNAGVPCGPIYKINESFADPQVQHLAMAQEVHSPALGDLTILGHPVSHGEKRNPLRHAAPELGADNEEILTSIGYTKEQIADLAQRGVI